MPWYLVVGRPRDRGESRSTRQVRATSNEEAVVKSGMRNFEKLYVYPLQPGPFGNLNIEVLEDYDGQVYDDENWSSRQISKSEEGY